MNKNITFVSSHYIYRPKIRFLSDTFTYLNGKIQTKVRGKIRLDFKPLGGKSIRGKMMQKKTLPRKKTATNVQRLTCELSGEFEDILLNGSPLRPTFHSKPSHNSRNTKNFGSDFKRERLVFFSSSWQQHCVFKITSSLAHKSLISARMNF